MLIQVTITSPSGDKFNKTFFFFFFPSTPKEQFMQTVQSCSQSVEQTAVYSVTDHISEMRRM